MNTLRLSWLDPRLVKSAPPNWLHAGIQALRLMPRSAFPAWLARLADRRFFVHRDQFDGLKRLHRRVMRSAKKAA